MDGFKIRIRVEIVPASEADEAICQRADISHVDEEAVRKVSASQAVSIDDMEERVLDGAYEVMRRALGEHFTKVSKKGLSSTRRPENR